MNVKGLEFSAHVQKIPDLICSKYFKPQRVQKIPEPNSWKPLGSGIFPIQISLISFHLQYRNDNIFAMSWFTLGSRVKAPHNFLKNVCK